jgi:hypothetical protein
VYFGQLCIQSTSETPLTLRLDVALEAVVPPKYSCHDNPAALLPRPQHLLTKLMLAHATPMTRSRSHGSTQEVSTIGPSSSTTSTQSHTIYSKPLGGTPIRLLALQPSENDERLVCHLRNVDLADESVSYEAVSYVWGSRTVKIHQPPSTAETTTLAMDISNFRYRKMSPTHWKLFASHNPSVFSGSIRSALAKLPSMRNPRKWP